MEEKDVRVLLVDDERLVRRSMEKTLLRAGYDVESAGEVREALEVFRQAEENGEPFDIAVLDLHMPNFEGVDDPNAGLELLSRLVKIRPTLPVVVLTAFDEVRRAKEAVTRGARAYFVKGRESGLIELIEEILS